MSIFGDALSFAEHVGGSMVNDTAHLAEDGYKLATDSNYREQAWHSALNHVKAAANFGKAAIRSVDAAKDQLGSMINSGEQYLEKKVDDGRAWLRQHGGVAGQVLSDQVGFDERNRIIALWRGQGPRAARRRRQLLDQPGRVGSQSGCEHRADQIRGELCRVARENRRSGRPGELDGGSARRGTTGWRALEQCQDELRK